MARGKIAGEFGIDHREARQHAGGAQAGFDAVFGGLASTALRVTSLPVPAVVGMAMQGAAGCGERVGRGR